MDRSKDEIKKNNKSMTEGRARWFVLLALLGAGFFVPGFAHAQEAQAIPEPEYVEDQVLVRNKPTAGDWLSFMMGQQAGVTEVQRVAVPEGLTAEEYVAQLQADETVLTVERDVIRRATATPDDAKYAYQWHHYQDDVSISSETAWDTQTGSANVVVAVIDTGVDTDHEDLADNMWENPGEIAGNGIDDDGNGYVDDVNGYDFVDEDGDPNPEPNSVNDDGVNGTDSGVEHGTHVAGIIGAVGNNGTGVSGVAWTVSIMGVKVLDDEGAGSDSAIAEGIEYAVDNGADIINMSLGGFGSTTALEEATDYATENGVLVISALGNNGLNVNDVGFYPACYSGVLGVTSVGDDGEASSFSNYGTDCADIAAPGENIYSTYYTDDSANNFTTDYGYLTGTSMATPVVAGVAALLKAERSDATDDQLIDVLTTSAVDTGLEAKYGVGRVDAAKGIEGLEILDNPPAPTIKAYNAPSKKKKYKDGARKADKQPYFTWNEPSDDDGIAGYYVYYGKDKKANPETKGSYQTKRTFEPSKKEGDEVSYYLRVKAKDNAGDVTVTAASHEYIIDTEVTKAKGVEVERVSDGLKVSWKKVKNQNVSKYIVRRKNLSAKHGKFKKIGSVSSSTLEYTDKTVKRDKKYEYRIRVRDDLDNESNSSKEQKKFYPRERVVVGAGPGGSPQVRIYNVKNRSYEQTWYAFDENLRTGVEVAVGNIDGDKKDEVVVALDAGSQPLVGVYDGDGDQLAQITAYDSGFTGGVRIGTGDFDGDGEDEIVTAPGPGGTPHIRVFEMTGGELVSFMALDGAFTGGVYVAGVDWDGDGVDEIAVSAGAGGGPQVSLYNGQTGSLITSFNAYDSGFTGGVRVSRANFGGSADVLLTAPATGSSHTLSYQKSGDQFVAVNPGFSAFVSSYTAGVLIGSGDVNQKNEDRIVAGTNGGTQASVTTYTDGGASKHTFFPFGSFTGPARVASGWYY